MVSKAKSFLENKIFDRVTHLERCWRNSLFLWKKNKLAAEPIALFSVERDHGTAYIMITRAAQGESIRDQLNHILNKHSTASELLNLISKVAHSIRCMHDLGMQHGDLGNQNIIVSPNGALPLASQCTFIDLDRAKLKPSLTFNERARDLWKINLPTKYMKIFVEMYFDDKKTPEGFFQTVKRWQHFWHIKHHWLSKSRLKHNLLNRSSLPFKKRYWIWETKQAQPTLIFSASEKRKLRGLRIILSILWGLIIFYPTIRRSSKALLKKAYKNPVKLKHKIGLALTPDLPYQQDELDAIKALGIMTIHIRIGSYEPLEKQQEAIAYIKKCKAAKFAILLSLSQDSLTIQTPGAWEKFVFRILDATYQHIESVEIGHAVNRAKWGVWTEKDIQTILSPISEICSRYKKLKVMAAPVIDFDQPWSIYTARRVSHHLKLNGLSQHLYVDRRGQPENQQNGYATLEKLAVSKAIAQCFPGYQDCLVISEVNWPLENAGSYSPIAPPYLKPGQQHQSPLNVTENDYTHYMLRYLTIALCSGYADAVYWWRLSAKGYGLLDDQNNFSKRPAFYGLKYFMQTLGDATFLCKLHTNAKTYIFIFQQPNKNYIIFAWALEPVAWQSPVTITTAQDCWGKTITLDPPNLVKLNQSPCYLYLASTQAVIQFISENTH